MNGVKKRMNDYFRQVIVGTELRQFDMKKDSSVIRSLFRKNRVKAWQIVDGIMYLELYPNDSDMNVSREVKKDVDK